MHRNIYSFRGEYKPTALRAKIEKQVGEWRDKIIHERLDPWRFLGARPGIVVRVTKHSGKDIHYEGQVTFDGAPEKVFWSNDFMPPFLEDAIEDVFAKVARVCREHDLPPEDYLTEAAGYLEGMVWTIYNEMARMEARLTHRQHHRDVFEYADKLRERIEAHRKAARLLAGPRSEPDEREKTDETTPRGGHNETKDVLEEGSDFWTITFQGKKLPAIRGREAFAYLAYVLTHPKQWISAVALIEAVHEPTRDQRGRTPHPVDDQDEEPEERPVSRRGIKHRDSENKADRKYLKECHEKLSALRSEQQRAKDNADEARADECQREIDELTRALRRLIGPGGRLQKFTNEIDRAYSTVWKAVERVKSKVEHHSSEFGQHLENCIHFDKPCISYQPEAPTEWDWAKPQKEKS